MRRSTLLAAVLLVTCLPAAAWPADEPVQVVTRAVEAIAPGATAVAGGFRFTLDGVAVSVLTDEDAGLLRVVAWASDLGDRDVRLVASALSPDMIPDLGARLVSVRGLLCAAVLAPLRGLTEGVFRSSVAGAVRMAREASRVGPVPAGLAIPVNLPVHAGPVSR